MRPREELEAHFKGHLYLAARGQCQRGTKLIRVQARLRYPLLDDLESGHVPGFMLVKLLTARYPSGYKIGGTCILLLRAVPGIMRGRPGAIIQREIMNLAVALTVASCTGRSPLEIHMDLTKAYEGIHHAAIAQVLQTLGVDKRCTALVISMYSSRKLLILHEAARLARHACGMHLRCVDT
eukprot:234042-Amphidinium_carterae.1